MDTERNRQSSSSTLDFGPPRVLTACAARGSALSVCLTLGFLSFDILTGWNFDNPDLKDLSCQILQVLTVAFLYLSPPCTMFSSLQQASDEPSCVGPPLATSSRLGRALYAGHPDSSGERSTIHVRASSKSHLVEGSLR